MALGAPAAAASPRAVVLDVATLRVVDRVAANGSVTAAVADGRDGWYVGGDFTRIADAPHASVARLTAAGDADAGFLGTLTQHQTSHATGVSALAVDGGRLYVSGGFRFAGGTHRPGLAALDARTGRADRAFRPPPGLVNAAVLTVHDRRLYVGHHTAIPLGRRTGALVAGWRGAPGGFAEIGRVTAVVPDGERLLLGGTFLRVDGAPRISLAAVEARSGRVDRALAPRLRSRFRICRPLPCIPVLALARDGSDVYVAGQFDAVDGVARRHLVRLDAATGAVDRGWRPAVPARMQAIEGPLVVAGGRLLALGDRRLVAFDLRTGARRDLLPGRRIATVARSGHRVLVGLLPSAP